MPKLIFYVASRTSESQSVEHLSAIKNKPAQWRFKILLVISARKQSCKKRNIHQTSKHCQLTLILRPILFVYTFHDKNDFKSHIFMNAKLAGI